MNGDTAIAAVLISIVLVGGAIFGGSMLIDAWRSTDVEVVVKQIQLEAVQHNAGKFVNKQFKWNDELTTETLR